MEIQIRRIHPKNHEQPEENTVQYDPENGEDSQEDQEETPDPDDDRNQDGAEVPAEETPAACPGRK